MDKSTQSRQPTPQEAALFTTAMKQAAKFLTTEDSARTLFLAAKQEGAPQAVADAVKNVVGGVAQSAQAAGVTIPPHVLEGQYAALVQMEILLMAKSGLVKDPAAAMQQTMQIIMSAASAQQAAPAAPQPMQAPPAPPASPAPGLLTAGA